MYGMWIICNDSEWANPIIHETVTFFRSRLFCSCNALSCWFTESQYKSDFRKPADLLFGKIYPLFHVILWYMYWPLRTSWRLYKLHTFLWSSEMDSRISWFWKSRHLQMSLAKTVNRALIIRRVKSVHLSSPYMFESWIKLMLQTLEVLETQGVKIFPSEMPVKNRTNELFQCRITNHSEHTTMPR